MRLAIGLLLALAAAVTLNWSLYAQHTASNTLPRIHLRTPFASLRILFSDLAWLMGYLVGWVGWALYIAALRFAPLSLVQGVVAGGVGLLALFVSRLGRTKLSRRERVAVTCAVGGLAVLALSIRSVTPTEPANWRPAMAWIVVASVLAALSAGPGRSLLRAGAGLGAAGGLLYASGDIATKAAVSGIGLFFIPIVLIGHVIGFVAIQLALQRGSALSTAGLASLLNNAVPIAAGVTLFHESVPAGAAGGFRIAGFAGVVIGASLLGRTEAGDAAAPILGEAQAVHSRAEEE